MAHLVTKGLVLREVNYKESDKILTILAEGQGKRTVKAQGCRRKNSVTYALSIKETGTGYCTARRSAV